MGTPMSPEQRPIREEPEGSGSDVSLVDVVTFLLRRRHIIIGITLLGSIVSLIVALSAKPYFTASVQFVPSASKNMISRLGELIGTPGKVESLAETGSDDYYKALITSSSFLERVVIHPAASALKGGGKTLAEDLVAARKTEGDTVAAAGELLQKSLKIDVGLRSRIVSISFTAPDPSLAAAVVNAVIDELVTWNRSANRSKGQENRQFIEQQLSGAGKSLKSAEEALARFSATNRKIATPDVEIEVDRLKRDVQVQADLFTTLRRQLELAKIEEKEEQPFVDIIQRGVVPTHKSGPSRTRIVILGVFLAGMCSLGVAWLVDGWGRMERASERYREFFAEVDGVREEVVTLGGLRRNRAGLGKAEPQPPSPKHNDG